MKQISCKNKIETLLDLVGFSASTLCAIHCAILPFLISFLPLLGLEFLENPVIEWVFLASSITLAFTSFLIGYYKHHHDNEALSIMLIAFIFFVIGNTNAFQGNPSTLFEEICLALGGIIMAYAHYRNWKLCKINNCKICK
ncbi:MAG: MerC domain-containing protein [Sphingobacteriaceae bacterium]|jgi:hypothetical protein